MELSNVVKYIRQLMILNNKDLIKLLYPLSFFLNFNLLKQIKQPHYPYNKNLDFFVYVIFKKKN